MINYLAAFAALSVAGVAAFYSIVGLSTIFSGAFWAVVIMASVLEFAKIVTALYVHLRWSEINTLFKTYLSFAVLVLMLITSLGIFGFLSKAHIDSTTVISNNDIEIELIDNQIKSEQKVIDYVDSQFNLLDNAYEQWIDKGYITRALNERETQKEDRKQLATQQAQAATSLKELTKSRGELQREAVAQQSEIGPIKYVAEIVYGDDGEDRIDDAARLLIILLIFAFDPLAILLLLSSTAVIYKEDNYLPPIVSVDEIDDLRDASDASSAELNEYIKRKREIFPRK
jgi:hypothetical protein